MKYPVLLALLLGILPMLAVLSQTDNNIIIDEDLQLIHLEDSIYIHVSWHHEKGYGRFASNGLIVIREGKALMVDTPMDNEKTSRLYAFILDSLNAITTTLISGHSHADCLGGLSYLQKEGVVSIANHMTVEKCKESNKPLPFVAFTDSISIQFDGIRIECVYYGPGHADDNIVVWIPEKEMLFGGCLIKSMDARGLGNVSAANLSEWDNTVNHILKAYPSIKYVVPGHGEHGGPELLKHTIKLVEEEKGISR